jgi:hypothetical protein
MLINTFIKYKIIAECTCGKHWQKPQVYMRLPVYLTVYIWLSNHLSVKEHFTLAENTGWPIKTIEYFLAQHRRRHQLWLLLTKLPKSNKHTLGWRSWSRPTFSVTGKSSRTAHTGLGTMLRSSGSIPYTSPNCQVGSKPNCRRNLGKNIGVKSSCMKIEKQWTGQSSGVF